jgi:hypothetical protein
MAYRYQPKHHVAAHFLRLLVSHKHQALVRAALRNAGIATDRGKQVILVAPGKMYWHTVLLNAVYAETGTFPWLIQTREQRDIVGNPGETTILNTHGLMGLRS